MEMSEPSNSKQFNDLSIKVNNNTDNNSNNDDQNQDSETDSTYSQQSSHDSDSLTNKTKSRSEINENDIKLTQMRRVAAKRIGQSRINKKLEGLKSYDDMLREHAMLRMQDGLLKVLQLHTPVELSSLCGCLGLKVQDKASNSIHFIIKYANEGNYLDELKIKKILNFMWEGALWEYLHVIGHPCHNMRPDPKNTIYEIWLSGGLLDNDFSKYIPHFISREVKKRNEWIKSPDILQYLEKLKKAQDEAKAAENRIISHHEYTNILLYFKQMATLRRLETEFREYMISEVEINRSRVDSCEYTAKITRKQLSEVELYSKKLVNALNQQLGQMESLCELKISERYQIESDLTRLSNVLESYIATEYDRQSIGGGIIQALKLRNNQYCLPEIQKIEKKLQKYKEIIENSDNKHRIQARTQLSEIIRLNQLVDTLQIELDQTNDILHKETIRANNAEKSLFYCRRKLIRLENKHYNISNEAWSSSIRFASKQICLERKLQAVKPVLLACMKHSSTNYNALGRSILEMLDIGTIAELDLIEENTEMRRQDILSAKMRAQEEAKLLAETNNKKVKNSKKDKIGMQKKKSKKDINEDSMTMSDNNTDSRPNSSKQKSKSNKKNINNDNAINSPSSGKNKDDQQTKRPVTPTTPKGKKKK